VKLQIKRDGPGSPTAIHGNLGMKFDHLKKPTAIADCVEKQLIPHDLCEKNLKLQVEARIQDLLEAVYINYPERMEPRDLQKLIKIL
jgi:hypothetical protein